MPCAFELDHAETFAFVEKCLRLFEEAARKYPQNLVALIDGSRALGARFEITRAETMLDRLMKLGAQQPDIELKQ